MAKISVIVPVYNVEKYLRQCLDSIVNQTFKDFECICVNDGSIDSSLSILKEYAKKDNRFKVISQENKGLSCARNTGIRKCNSKYITFVDSDDWISNKYLEYLYNEIEKTNSDISCCNLKEYYEQDNIFKSNIIPQEKFFDINDLDSIKIEKGYNQPSACTKIYRIDFLKKNNIKFFEGFINEDCPFIALCFLCAEKVSYIENQLYFYRLQMKNSITSNKCNMTIHKIITFIKLIQDISNRNKFNDDIFNYMFKLLLWDMSSFNKDMYDLKTKEYILMNVLNLLEFLEQYKNILNFKNKLKLKFFTFILIKYKVDSFKIIRVIKNLFI